MEEAQQVSLLLNLQPHLRLTEAVLQEELKRQTMAVQEAAALPQLVPTQLLLKVLLVVQDHTI
jgi:hypothetical protein